MGRFRLFLCLVAIWLLVTSFCFSEGVTIELTEAEQAFIQSHPTIYLGIDPQFVPFEFVDTDGVYKGVAAEYIKLLNEKLGINMVVTRGLTWSQAYEQAVEREIDVLPCISLTKERERYFLFTDAYYQFQRVIVINDSNKDIKALEDLYHTRVAVQTNSSHHSFLKDYPTIELSLYPTVESALKAVANGKESAFVGNLATTNYMVKTHGITDLKFVKIESSEIQGLHFAVRNDWPELVSILNKGLNAITESEKIAVNNKWIGVEYKADFGPILRVIAGIGLLTLIILAVSGFWILKLRKEVIWRKQTEEALFKAKGEAELANQIKSSFLARMSHEIRTPLNAITGMSYLLKKTEVNKTQLLYIEKITQASHNMLGIINDILDFSKIESGRVEIETIAFDLDKILQQVISIVAFKVDEQKIDFTVSKDPMIPSHYFGDPKRIEQILLNLLNNAIKFTGKGEVALAIKVKAIEDQYYQLIFSVKDTGIGMTEEQLQVLFTPFAQADSSINRRFGGTGLGMSIVKSLVDMMGGEIEVDSVYGVGTTFVVKLPLTIDEAKAFEERQKIASFYLKDIKVLVLENNDMQLYLLTSYLNSFGIKADTAKDSSAAFKMVLHHCETGQMPYNLLIMDYETPEEGGFGFMTKLRGLPLDCPQPKVMMLVPIMREDLLDNLEEKGVELGVTKPVIPSVLYNGILEIFKVHAFDNLSQISEKESQVSQKMDEKYSLLVVEDNKTNQFIAKSILEEVGFKVELADNGEVAVRYFETHSDELDLILMDLHMPVLNGYEASQQIRQMDSKIPIVAMTADAITGVEEECQKAGIDYYVSKPFDPEKLIRTLSDILRQQVKKRGKVSSSTIQAVTEHEGLKGPVIDEGDGLRRMGNNKDLYHLVLAEYYNENKAVSQQLKEAIESQDYQEAVQIVHKNKGGSGNIGAKVLQQTGTTLQKALEKKSVSEILAFEESFLRELDLVLKAIETTEGVVL